MHSFDRVELGLDEIAGREEAKRCMRCDICERCGKCVEVCRDHLWGLRHSFLSRRRKFTNLERLRPWIAKMHWMWFMCKYMPYWSLATGRQGRRAGTVDERDSDQSDQELEKCDGCGAQLCYKSNGASCRKTHQGSGRLL